MDYATRTPPRERSSVNQATIRVRIEPLDEGGFLATSPDVPGLIAEGRNVTEAVEIARGLVRKIAESCIQHGDPLPRALVGIRNGPALAISAAR